MKIILEEVGGSSPHHGSDLISIILSPLFIALT